VPVGVRPSPEPVPDREQVDGAHGGRDPGQPPVHRPSGVEEADYVAAQQASAPRGPAGLATRRYLLAGLISCGICGRRLESAWSNGKPAYRCRHGHKSSSPPDPGRPKNSYVREEQILPRLAALAILLDDQQRQRQPSREIRGAAPRLTSTDHAAGLIDRLRQQGLTLTYDPRDRTLCTGAKDPVALTI
jgi:site-specific DNA recombinase